LVNVTRSNEIYLFGNYYPIIGAVSSKLVQRWATKQVTGDYTKDSEKDTSSIVFGDNHKGIGIKDMDEIKDAGRVYWSTCGIDYPGHTTLPPLATACANPGTTAPAVTIEYVNEQYVAFGTDLRKWVNASAAFGTSLHTLLGVPTDAIVHKSKLYFACTTDFERFDGTNYVHGVTLSGGAKTGILFVEWDEKLFMLSNTGQLSYTVDEGVTWVNSALSNLGTGMYTSLFLSDYSGVQIMLGTKFGPYVLDYDSAKWIYTGFSVPEQDYACKGATAWRGIGYVPVGMGVYQYNTSGDTATILPMGPDRDYGLPGDYRGNIIKLLPEHNALYALVSPVIDLQNMYLSGPFDSVTFYNNTGYSTLLKWTGEGWKVVWASESIAVASNCAAITTADSTYRLWFGADNKMYYIPLRVDLQNPVELDDFPYGAKSENIWPWFDANNAVIDKLGFKVTAYTERLTATEYVKLYYALDYADGAWQLLTNTTYTDGQIDSNGETYFTLASDAGLSFKSIQFKAELFRGSNTLLSPDLRWLRLDYMKLLPARWSYRVVIDATKDYRHKRKSTLLAALQTAAEQKTLGDFAFRTFEGTTDTHKVKCNSMAGPEKEGKLKEGQFAIDLIEL